MKRHLIPKSKVARKDWLMMGWTGFFGITLYFYFENNGVKMISAGSAAIIVSAIPIATLISEAIADRKPLGLRILGCALLSVIGVGVLTGIAPAPGDNPLGYWFMGGAVVSFVAYCLISRKLFQKYNSLTITYYQTVIGTILFLPFTAMETTLWDKVTPLIWLNVAILGVFASAIGFYLYLLAMDRLGIGIGSLYLNLIPIVALLTGVIFMGDAVSWGQCGGAALIIAAVVGARKK
jgi:drug/metabolite transporter (DMT)-like permease